MPKRETGRLIYYESYEDCPTWYFVPKGVDFYEMPLDEQVGYMISADEMEDLEILLPEEGEE